MGYLRSNVHKLKKGVCSTRSTSRMLSGTRDCPRPVYWSQTTMSSHTSPWRKSTLCLLLPKKRKKRKNRKITKTKQKKIRRRNDQRRRRRNDQWRRRRNLRRRRNFCRGYFRKFRSFYFRKFRRRRRRRKWRRRGCSGRGSWCLYPE